MTQRHILLSIRDWRSLCLRNMRDKLNFKERKQLLIYFELLNFYSSLIVNLGFKKMEKICIVLFCRGYILSKIFCLESQGIYSLFSWDSPLGYIWICSVLLLLESQAPDGLLVRFLEIPEVPFKKLYRYNYYCNFTINQRALKRYQIQSCSTGIESDLSIANN